MCLFLFSNRKWWVFGESICKPSTIWLFNSSPWKDQPFLSSVNNLFLWVIYPMAMLVITRGYIEILVIWNRSIISLLVDVLPIAEAAEVSTGRADAEIVLPSEPMPTATIDTPWHVSCNVGPRL